MTPLFPRLAAAASLAIAASSTQAQPVNFVEVGNNVLANCVGGGVATSSSALGRMLVCSDNSGTGMASASASVGHVGASANSFAFQGTAAVNFGARANYFDTVTFSGPGAIPISTTLNLDFGGVINTALQGTAGVKVAATVNGTTVGSFVAAHHDGISISCLSTFGSLSTNCDDVTFGGGSFAGRLQTQTVTVPIGTPVAIFLEIEVLTSAQAQGASATSTFSNSLDLAVGRDLFDLPVGYTVNSATSLITDNQFTPQIAAVPEPDAVVLLGLGLAMMVGTLRPRRWTVCGLIRRRLKPPELAPHEQPTRRINEMWGTSSPRWIARVAPCFGLRS